MIKDFNLLKYKDNKHIKVELMAKKDKEKDNKYSKADLMVDNPQPIIKDIIEHIIPKFQEPDWSTIQKQEAEETNRKIATFSDMALSGMTGIWFKQLNELLTMTPTAQKEYIEKNVYYMFSKYVHLEMVYEKFTEFIDILKDGSFAIFGNVKQRNDKDFALHAIAHTKVQEEYWKILSKTEMYDDISLFKENRIYPYMCFTEAVRYDPEVFKLAYTKNRFSAILFGPSAYKEDKEFILEALKKPTFYDEKQSVAMENMERIVKYVPKQFLEDQDFINKALLINPKIIVHLPIVTKQTLYFFLTREEKFLMKTIPIQNISLEILNDKNQISFLCKKTGNFLTNFLNEELKNDKNFILDILKVVSKEEFIPSFLVEFNRFLREIPKAKEFLEDRNFVTEIVKANPFIITSENLPNQFKEDLEIIKEAFEKIKPDDFNKLLEKMSDSFKEKFPYSEQETLVFEIQKEIISQRALSLRRELKEKPEGSTPTPSGGKKV